MYIPPFSIIIKEYAKKFFREGGIVEKRKPIRLILINDDHFQQWSPSFNEGEQFY